MISSPKIRVLVYLAVLFIAGGVTGTVFTWGTLRRHSGGPPSPERILIHLQDRFTRELGLSDAQQSQLRPLLERRVLQIQAIHEESMERVDVLIKASNAELSRELQLSADQLKRLDELERERQAFMRRRSCKTTNAAPASSSSTSDRR
jgi:hypothetical protein